ncbi:MAG TPA: HNH endonuclease, partial [Actinomycetes bacterium]|nr:HNH endonuclease [Actinomycetes bacterium]
VDHIVPRAWDASDAALYDERNAVACCGRCNRKRQHLPPGTYGAYGTQPKRRSWRAGPQRAMSPFFRGDPKPRGGLGNFSPRPRWATAVVDLSRRTPDAHRG